MTFKKLKSLLKIYIAIVIAGFKWAPEWGAAANIPNVNPIPHNIPTCNMPERTPNKTAIDTAVVPKKTRKYVPIISAKYGL